MLFGFLFICECTNNLSETQQPFINTNTLLQQHTCRSRLLDPLRPRQVDKMKLGRNLFGCLRYLFPFFLNLNFSFDLLDDLLFDGDCKYGV